jgi:threonine dehydrogenase-like Zn-dependent dehydrogenase
MLDREVPTSTPAHPALDNTRKMQALVWHGKRDVKCDIVPRPLITDKYDVILRVTATTICGSDLHLYTGAMMGMKSGDILGHEFMGIVEEVGAEVKNFRIGQRVVSAFDIACGKCSHCDRQEFTACATTNPSKAIREAYGHPTGAIFGYSHLTGGVPGGQAEYVRVPFADVNCLPVPDDLPDDKALYLSDIIPTSFHGTELGGVTKGSIVAIWGLGPVGLLTARWCQIKEAGRIIGIDCVPERLNIAKNYLNIETIDFSKVKTTDALSKMVPQGVDVSIECAGFEYAKTLLHKVEMAIGLETDSPDILTEMITATRPFGTLSIIGVYVGYTNHFPIGAMMEKDLIIKCGQSPTQKYWKMCLEKLQSGEFDPSFVVTHRAYLSDGPELYKKFYNKEDGVIKVFLRTNTQPVE